MKKQIYVSKEKRDAVIEECAKELDNCGHHKAAIILRMMIK